MEIVRGKKEAMLLGVEGVAQILGITPRALRMRLLRGAGAPQPLRLSGRLCWRPTDVEAWLLAQAQEQGVAYSTQSAPEGGHQPPLRRRPGRPRKGI